MDAGRVRFQLMLKISETTTVKDLLSAHPEVFPVLLRHGMCADCQEDPPPVPLSIFAVKHCGGNLLGLLKEIREAMIPAA